MYLYSNKQTSVDHFVSVTYTSTYINFDICVRKQKPAMSIDIV